VPLSVAEFTVTELAPFVVTVGGFELVVKLRI
jgi:hypothetical protein